MFTGWGSFLQRQHSLLCGQTGVATGWTCPVSTPLLPEVVPEIDANAVFLLGEREGVG